MRPRSLWGKLDALVEQASSLSPVDLRLHATFPHFRVAPHALCLRTHPPTRARQITAYYRQLQEGLLVSGGPLVETEISEKPLSIALREINQGLVTSEATEES